MGELFPFDIDDINENKSDFKVWYSSQTGEKLIGGELNNWLFRFVTMSKTNCKFIVCKSHNMLNSTA